MSNHPTIDINDAVWIQDALYCRSAEGLERVTGQLSDLGYVVKDMRYEPLELWHNPAVKSSPHPVWLAALNLVEMTKCLTCEARMSYDDVTTPGAACGSCGTAIEPPRRKSGEPSKKYTSFFKVWNDVEYERAYGTWGPVQLPMLESFEVVEAWRWTPLEPSPGLYRRVIAASPRVSDPSYYYQDGRPAFDYRDFDDMAVFIEYFTTLDVEAWRHAARRFRHDGPGAIADIAAFCSPDSVVTSRPSIGNVLAALSGIDVSPGNLRDAARALQDNPVARDFFRA